MQIFIRIRCLVVTYPCAHAEHPDMMVVEWDRRRSDHCLDAMSVDVLISLVDQHLGPEDAAVFRCVSKFARDAVDATGRNLRDELTERDLQVLRAWRESCPELRDLWRGDDASHWEGVTWSDGRVTGLSLRNRWLSGELPRLEGLTSLREVDLYDTHLPGPIPEKLFEGLTLLQTVDLSSNRLWGPIPERLFEGLTSLKKVYLDHNYLSGPIPEKLFKGLTSLQTLYLDWNHLSGPIPEKLFEGLTSLEGVGLNTNQLSGPIPEKLFEGLTSFREVYLSGNEELEWVYTRSNEPEPIPERLRAVVKL